MAVKMKVGVPCPYLPTTASSPFSRKLTSNVRLFDVAENSRNLEAFKPCQLKRKLSINEIVSNRQCALFGLVQGQESEHDMDKDSEPYPQDSSADDDNSTVTSYNHIEGTLGKPGFISFCGVTKRRDDQTPVPTSQKSQNYLMWLVGPTVLVASFVFSSLYLLKILSTIFEDSLLTGTRTFLTGIGHAASAALAPYLVGISVQFAFDEYAKHISSPSLSAIPLIFQIYRLHQLNPAAHLVTALSFTIKGAEVTAHNLAINRSLIAILNVLQFLGIVKFHHEMLFIYHHSQSAYKLSLGPAQHLVCLTYQFPGSIGD